MAVSILRTTAPPGSAGLVLITEMGFSKAGKIPSFTSNNVYEPVSASIVMIVKEGTADLMVADMTTCMLAVVRNPDAGLLTLSQPLNIEPIGIAIPAEDARFENLVSNILNTLKGARVLHQLRKKWLEDDAWVSSLP